MKTFTKDPTAIKDYLFDWSDWLNTDTITEVTFTVSGVTLVSFTFTADGKATIWISGGTLGITGMVSCKITTSEGRVDTKSAIFIIKPE